MKSDHQKRVEKFMVKAGKDTPQEPWMPCREVRRHRCDIGLEEMLEKCHAFGFKVQSIVFDGYNEKGKAQYVITYKETEPDFQEMMDGMGDVSVVNTGDMVACGICDEILLTEVDLNNLAKFGPGHSYRQDGKLIKPPNHQPPDFQKVLRKQLSDWNGKEYRENWWPSSIPEQERRREQTSGVSATERTLKKMVGMTDDEIEKALQDLADEAQELDFGY